ncbi:MAG TPA: ATPase, T2SS/T4P/T4SS family [Candidatus Nitrosotenuis sp.]|jgi:type IV pilus assembly protein PilB|nr:ATPase, T2SS/T4P/T4SS family [Candidatus Nitrosotenuis sp.]
MDLTDLAAEVSAEETEEELQAKAKRMRVKYVNLATLEVDPEIGQIIPEAMARRYNLVCIGKLEKKVTLAMADPLDVFAIDDITMRTGFTVDAVLSRLVDIKAAIEKIYGQDQRWKELVDQATDTHVEVQAEEEEAEDEAAAEAASQPVIKLTNMIIVKGIEKKASDIHVEPFENEVIVRYRIDGVLVQDMQIPRHLLPAVVARIKIMSQLRIDEKRVPQDGRIQMSVGGRDLDLRVSTLPTVMGESVVMRVLDRGSTRVELTQLGFDEKDLLLWKKLIDRPHGIILVTGPTGSGKSTTLYATLNVLNQPDVKILTVEDPVEYNLKGVVQVQTNNKAGLTFARALKAFLRQDPDIIMLGEIRDKETGTIAIEAALTGHLVLSTLHTNSAIASVVRLTDMGIEPFLVSSTLNGVLAQRLVRRVCSQCAEPLKPNDELRKIFEQNGLDPDTAQLMRGRGCPNCNQMGYRGRVGIYELFECTDTLRQMIVRRAHEHELAAEAAKNGMTTLYQDGLRKVHKGWTTYEELLTATTE